MKVSLTKEEARLILRAIRIAREDGSIYGGLDEEDEEQIAERNKELDSIVSKLEAGAAAK